MSPLTLDDFAGYFEAVHGMPPFPWQRRLVERLLAGGGWPRTVALPTASGKTAILDAAVFALAAEPTTGAARRNPLRIFFVVDRRVVVDEAFERARRIERALATAGNGVLGTVAGRLRELSGAAPTEAPLDAAIMRGGIYRDDRWARSPVQPTIVVSTVDQVGSRLLFRGYGLSPRSRPIHAGLVGNDSLIILDEAHCSRPFAETLGWIERYRGAVWAEDAPATPFEVVSMSATPPPGIDAFGADDADRGNTVLGRRLAASKPARLVVGRKGDAFLADLLEQVSLLADQPRVIGAIVNRVDAARLLFEHCRKKLGRTNDVVLLTGRARPAERDALLEKYSERLRAAPNRPAPTRGLIVVATQCIEVGADLDFDALVTECAALDALRQRFGRLDRLGRAGTSKAVVVVREDQSVPGDDPVYGTALGATWKWLAGNAQDGVIDFGVNALDPLLPHDPAELSALTSPAAPAPVVMPAHCDMWAQTSPEPHVSPDPAAYLHGVRRQSPDVSLVWRGDLDVRLPDAWNETVSLLPPSAGEALALPLHAARAWLSGGELPGVADVEGAAAEDEPAPDAEGATPGRRALRWYGPDSGATAVVEPDALRPGDTLVVPASYGGCDEYGWSPGSVEPVRDLGDELAARRRRAVLRLHPGTLPQAAPTAVKALAALAAPEVEDLERQDVANALRELAAADGAPDCIRLAAGFLADDERTRFSPHSAGAGLVVRSPRLLPEEGDPDFTDEDETSSASTRAVGLVEHLNGVGTQASAWMKRLRVPPALAHSVALAARWHDLGKADRRFQTWLHGGDAIAAAREKAPLAKSAGAPRTGRALRAAAAAAGYPQGARHELVSLRLAEQVLGGHSDVDRDLVLHLIASHHGHCRPFAPAVIDDEPVQVAIDLDGKRLATTSATGLEALDSGVIERFWRLVRRYGWWGLAWAEAVARLADHRTSQREQEER